MQVSGKSGYSVSTLVGSKLARLLSKIEDFPRKLLYFVNRHNAKSSKCAKIGLSTTIFYDNNHLNLSKIDLCPIFVDSALCLFTKYNNFL